VRACFIGLQSRSLFSTSRDVSHGGAELQAFLVAKELARRGVAVSFVLDEGETPLDGDVGQLDLHCVRIIGRGLPGISRVLNRRRLFAVIRRARPDVVIQTSAGGVTARAADCAHRLGSRFVYRVACDWDVDGSIVTKPRERAEYLRGLRSSDAIVVRNSHQRSELLSLHGKESTVIPSGFEMPAVAPSVEKEHVLWVASSQRLKQPWLFLDLAREFPEERFVMIMPKNDPALFAEIAEQARALPNLEFSDGVPFEEIQAFFDRAKVFVNTSTVEGFPNTFVQAAIGSTPVLSLNVDPDDVLADNGFGRCAGGDTARLSADLRSLLADEQKRERMGAAGFDYARRTHDLRAVVDQWVSLLERVCR